MEDDPTWWWALVANQSGAVMSRLAFDSSFFRQYAPVVQRQYKPLVRVRPRIVTVPGHHTMRVIMSKLLLVKSNFDYSDEFDVKGFALYTEEAWNNYLIAAQKFFDENDYIEQYFGTNEMIVVEDFDDMLRGYEVVEITNAEWETLNKLFSTYERGTFIEFDLEQ